MGCCQSKSETIQAQRMNKNKAYQFNPDYQALDLMQKRRI